MGRWAVDIGRVRPAGRSAAAVGAAAAGALLAILGLGSHDSSAAGSLPCPSPGVLSGGACTYTFVSEHGATVQVPAGVTLSITADGGGGASGLPFSGAGPSGGRGAEVRATFAVKTAETLTVIAGGAGGLRSAGDPSGGGGFGDSEQPIGNEGGKGGGGSFVFAPSGLLVVAGGGGGGGSTNGSATGTFGQGGAGGDAAGGKPGIAGNGTAGDCDGGGQGGGGATRSSPGSAGTAAPCTSNPAPSGQGGKGPTTGPTDPNINGGNGGEDTIGGAGGGASGPPITGNYGMAGGGGGGYTGGGGGGDSHFGDGGGGGGGSGFVSSSALTTSGQIGVNVGNGRVVVRYAATTTTTSSTTTTTTTTGSNPLKKQRQDVTKACKSIPGKLSPQNVLGHGIPVTLTIDVPGSLKITAVRGGGPAADRASAGAAAAADTCTHSGSTLPGADHPAPDIVIASKAGALATLSRTFKSAAGVEKLHVTLTAAGRKAFKKVSSLDKAYIKKHGHHGKPPSLKLSVMIRYSPAA